LVRPPIMIHKWDYPFIGMTCPLHSYNCVYINIQLIIYIYMYIYIHSIYNLIDCGKPHILFLRVIDFPAMDGMNHPFMVEIKWPWGKCKP
jgi:hypothetical protein